MLNSNDAVVKFKTSLIDRVLPADTVVVFGDMYIVEGGYTHYAATRGAASATLIDTLETRGWQRTRLQTPNLEFCKGNFADSGFMAGLPGPYAVGIAYDVLLHQPALLHTLHLMLERISGQFVFVQPTLEEQSSSNGLVFLPGQSDQRLYPLVSSDPEYHAFSTEEVNQSQWIWGITASFMRAALVTEGFEVTYEETLMPLSNSRWTCWGGIAARRRWPDARHWSHTRALPFLHPGWQEDGSVAGDASVTG